jgi:chondroitin AC lyase
MKNVRAAVGLVIAFVLALSALVAAPATAATVDEDIDVIISRLQEYYLGQGDEILLANGIYLARTSEALDYVASQKADGSWPDVDYADRTSSANGSTWSAYIALYRMLALTQAFVDPRSDGFDDPTVLAAVERALLHWDIVNPGNANWWETEVGESIAMGRISMFLRGDLSPAAFDVALKHNTGRLDPVGANGAWRTSNFIFEALSTGNEENIRSGFATIVATITVDESGGVNEAVQPDASFWAHGAQLYSEGYGMVLFTYAALWADVARGTSLAFARDQLDSIAFYIVDGTRWLIRGEVGMLYLNYRPSKTVEGVSSDASEFIEPLRRMARTDAVYASAYQALLDNILGETRTNGATGNKYFWRSEFSSHLRDDYGIFTRVNSSRTFGGELRTAYRDEIGNPVFWNSMGATAIQVNNREYLDVGAAFDWNHYPGVTAPYEKRTERGVENRTRNGDGAGFTGGVSDGRFGATVLTLDAARTTALKSYFSFDEGMVALGAGIRSSSDAPVHSVLNQTAGKQNASVGGEPIALGADGEDVGDARWAFNDEVGYVFPAGQDMKVSYKTQTGNWIDRDPVERDAFTLYIDHGGAPSDAGYEYTVLPGATPAQVQAYAAKPAVRTIRNDAEVQAVRHDGREITMATFARAGSVDLGAGRSLVVDGQAVVMLDESGDVPVASLSTPGRAALVTVSVTGGNAAWHGTYATAGAANLGKTISAPLVTGAAAVTSPFSASGTADGSDVASLGDGDPATEWTSPAGAPAWVATRVPRGSWVTKVSIDWADDLFASDFLVQTSTDGVAWTDHARVTDGAGGVSEVPVTPIAAEHVRVVMVGGPGERFGIGEVTVASSVNLALEAPTRASGYSGTSLVHLMNDGDPESRWRGNNANGAWAQVDLGATQPVSVVRLSWEAAYAKTYKIQLSDDGATWRDVYTTPAAGSDGGVDVITLTGQSARFVRMQTLTRSLNYGPSIWEFEVFGDRSVIDAPIAPAAGGNLALNRPTTADSFHNNNATIAPVYATDGSMSTRWASARAMSEHWLRVDLGKVRPVSRAAVSWETGTSNNYRIEGSVNGTDWTELARIDTVQPTLNHTLSFASADVRYVRLIGLPATQYGLNVYEFELYGGSTFACTEPVTVPAGGTATLAGTLTPVPEGAAITAMSLRPDVVQASGGGRIDGDGNVAVDVIAGRPGVASVLLTRTGGDEIAWCPVTVNGDTRALEDAIGQVHGLDSMEYTLETWTPVLAALQTAKRLLKTPGAAQDLIDRAAADVRGALAAAQLVDTSRLDVSGSVEPKMLGGKVYLSVAATNGGSVPVTIVIANAYGSKTYTAVQPGKTVSVSLNTRASSIPAGETTITATGTIDGYEVTEITTVTHTAHPTP